MVPARRNKIPKKIFGQKRDEGIGQYSTWYVRLNLQGPKFPRLCYGVLLEDSMHVDKIKTFDI
jgi:hypothetical protein